MGKATWTLAIVLFVVAGWWLYTHSSSHTVPTSGDVTQQTDIDGNPYPTDKAAAPTPAPTPAAAPTTVAAATTPAPIAAPVASTPVSKITPASDTLDRNAPAGMAFGGRGKYQWYRQGNLTWRIDTASGTTCVDFATMDEWQKPVVYSNGCRFRS